jgi:hypothetical protein
MALFDSVRIRSIDDALRRFIWILPETERPSMEGNSWHRSEETELDCFPSVVTDTSEFF